MVQAKRQTDLSEKRCLASVTNGAPERDRLLTEKFKNRAHQTPQPNQ